jgi:hypothetical protein
LGITATLTDKEMDLAVEAAKASGKIRCHAESCVKERNKRASAKQILQA